MRVPVFVLTLGLAASVTAAQERPWFARIQAGSATVHEWGGSGGWVQAQLGRSFAAGVLSADLGLAASSSDESYGSLTAGIEALPFPQAVVSPFVRAEAGLLVEPEYGGYVAGFGGGLSMRLSERLSARGGAAWGTHGDVRGQTVYHGGLQVRW